MEALDRVEFKSDLLATYEGNLIYTKRYMPSGALFTFVACWVLPMTVVAVLLYAVDVIRPEPEFIPREWLPIMMGLSFGLVAFLLIRIAQKLWLPTIRKWRVSKIVEQFPSKQVIVERGEDTLKISFGKSRSEFPYSEIYALAKSPKGLILGLGTSSFFVPKSAFLENHNFENFVKGILSKMDADSVSRSRDFL
jgi:YcxB-like protein